MYSYFWQYLDPNSFENEELKSKLMWSFEIIPAPAAQAVQPRVVKETLLDEYFLPLPIDANGEKLCNCLSPSLFCLVSVMDNVTENIASVSSEDEIPLAGKSTRAPWQVKWIGRHPVTMAQNILCRFLQLKVHSGRGDIRKHC